MKGDDDKKIYIKNETTVNNMKCSIWGLDDDFILVGGEYFDRQFMILPIIIILSFILL